MTVPDEDKSRNASRGLNQISMFLNYLIQLCCYCLLWYLWSSQLIDSTDSSVFDYMCDIRSNIWYLLLYISDWYCSSTPK